MPELHSARVIRQTHKRIASLERATVVIANSHATADAIRRFVDVACIVVVPLAPYPLPEATAMPSMVTGNYLLCVGEIAERKDHVTLVRAFAKAQLGDYRLIIAGPAGSGSARLDAEISRLGISESVLLTGRVDDLTLASLYAGATALCLTSRQEGFGLPLVEAMHRGLPIVASDLPAIREVTGPAAMLLAPTDVDAFASALEHVVADEDHRDRLAQAALQRADLFTLTRTVDGTIAAYRRALAMS
jgi:alpha-1,3-rhamnosyl/mannosyltransferase